MIETILRAEYPLFALGIGLSFLSGALFILRVVLKASTGSILTVVTRLGGIASLLAFVSSAVVRSIGAGRLPFASTYEYGMLMVMGLVIIALVYEFKTGQGIYGATIMPLVFVLSGVILLFFQEARPLMPALQSVWLTAHVVTAVLAYSMVAAGAALAVLYLTGKAPLAVWNAMNSLIVLSFPFLTLLIITGAVWAQYAWGSFWRWDPKETWSLITWLSYLAYLHGSRVRGWKPRTCAWVAVGAFAVVLFTYFGVNYLLAGVHSYG